MAYCVILHSENAPYPWPMSSICMNYVTCLKYFLASDCLKHAVYTCKDSQSYILGMGRYQKHIVFRTFPVLILPRLLPSICFTSIAICNNCQASAFLKHAFWIRETCMWLSNKTARLLVAHRENEGNLRAAYCVFEHPLFWRCSL